MKTKIILAIVLGLLAGLAIGRGCFVRTPQPAAATTEPQAAPHAEIWTCSMHPQIRQPKPGKCPICGMDLILATPDAATGTDLPRQAVLSPAARALAEVVVMPVERRAVTVDVRLVGKVRFDETRLATIAPRVPGRIDRLYADYTGMPVKTGDHLADMYSPELVSAQQELLQALKPVGDAAVSAALLNATRERLRLWGLTAEQIAEIERSGQVRDHVTFYAPIGGIVVEKDAREGQYVETGMRLFTVADLTQVWVLLDAYESDLAWLRYAQEVEFQAEAYPGKTFKGTIAFIDPLLDPMTRTVKVRVNVANADGRLKPEMFVRAVVHAAVDATGRVTRRDLRGKWISPMHPEIIKDAPGTCDVCGMPLVRAEDLGYAVSDQAAGELPLVIPATAPLVTGKRAVVYVAVPNQLGTYEGREVVLGPKAGDYYLVRAGLVAGERVVTQGAFKIDSSLQIQGQPSMMAPEGNLAPTDDQPTAAPTVAMPTAFRQQFDAVLANALTISGALANDDLVAAHAAVAQTHQALAAVEMATLTGEAHGRWMTTLSTLTPGLEKMAEAPDLAAFRLAFATLSTELTRAIKTMGATRAAPVYELHCPMAFNNRGATWLQADQTVRNPYFGKAMRGCGEVTATLPGAEPRASR